MGQPRVCFNPKHRCGSEGPAVYLQKSKQPRRGKVPAISESTQMRDAVSKDPEYWGLRLFLEMGHRFVVYFCLMHESPAPLLCQPTWQLCKDGASWQWTGQSSASLTCTAASPIDATKSSGPAHRKAADVARYLRIYVKDRTPLQHAEDAAWVIAFLGYWEASIQDTKGTLKVAAQQSEFRSNCCC